MSASRAFRRTLFCVLADRLGATVPGSKSSDAGAWDPESGRENPHAAGTEGLPTGWPARWAASHVEQCPRCQEERVAWGRLIDELRRADRPEAPRRILDAALARIADEREAGEWRVSAYTGREPRPRPVPRFTPVAVISVVAAVGGVASAAVVTLQAFGLLYPALAWIRSAAVSWKAEAGTLQAFFQSFAPSAPSAAEPYITAFLWCVAGLTAAILIPPGRTESNGR